MSSIHKKGRNWYVAYTDGDGKRHLTSLGIPHSPPGQTAEDARRKAMENKAKAMIQGIEIEQLARGSKRISVVRRKCAGLLQRARNTEAEQCGITLRTYLEKWIADKEGLVGSSYYQQLLLCGNEVCAALGDRVDAEIVQIDEEDIDVVVAYLKDRKLSGRSVNKRVFVLVELFAEAEEQAFVIVNPVIDRHFQTELALERQPFNSSEVDLIIKATKVVDWHTVTLLGFYGGLRLGDARKLTWNNIDLEMGVIGSVPTKTSRLYQRKAKIVILPIHPVLLAHLKYVRSLAGESEYVTPTLVNRPITNLSKEFVELVRAAGVEVFETKTPSGRIVCLRTFHSLRHTFATELKRAGAPMKEWTQLTGHSVKWSRWDGEVVPHAAKIYDHVVIEDLRIWINRLPIVTVPNSNILIQPNLL